MLQFRKSASEANEPSHKQTPGKQQDEGEAPVGRDTGAQRVRQEDTALQCQQEG